MNATLAKWAFIAGALLFADWVILILFGSFAKICKAEEAFYCSAYCITGIVLLILTIMLIIYLSWNKTAKEQ